MVDKILNDGLLSPSHHGVAFAELLAYKLQHGVTGDKHVYDLLEQTRALFLHMPAADVLLSSKAVSVISRQFAKAVVHHQVANRTIAPLKAIINKITGLEAK